MSNETDFYVREEDELVDFKCDQTIIIRKKYLKYVHPICIRETVEPLGRSLDWWPNCNSYYAHLEDEDALNRKEILQNVYKSDSEFNLPDVRNDYPRDCYSERDAQNKYLSTQPLSFVILGKPDVGEIELGKLLADYWRCLYIDPQTLVEDEIASCTRAGQCIEFNLRCGRAISAEVIMKLLEKRVNSASAKHRGFVLCGFPLVANELFEEDPVSSESAIFNVQEIFEDFVDVIIPEARTSSAVHLSAVTSESEPERSNQIVSNAKEEEIDEEVGEEDVSETLVTEEKEKKKEEVHTDTFPIDLGSVNFPICSKPDAYKDLDQQIDHLFSVIPKPFIIIYLVCENKEVVSKRLALRFDMRESKIVDLHNLEMTKLIHSAYSENPIDTSELPECFIQLTKFDKLSFDYSNRYDLLKLPRDFESSVASQLEKYRYEALVPLNKQVLLHDPLLVIRVDGRVSAARMFCTVKFRLDILQFQKAIIPETLSLNQEPTEPHGEGDMIEPINFEDLTIEESYKILCRKRIASPMFKWSWSEWYTECPVSMKDGVYVPGNPKYAMQFMNKIFFLANENALLKFYRNPRTYLLPPFPRPGSKIYVMGPPKVGKASAAQCLHFLQDLPVLHMAKLQAEFLDKKKEDALQKVKEDGFKEIITRLGEERLLDYQEKEAKRLDDLSNWKNKALKILFFFFKKSCLQQDEQQEVVEEEESELTERLVELENLYYDAQLSAMSLDEIKIKLDDCGVYCDCEAKHILLEEPDLILQFATDELAIPFNYNAPSRDEEVVKNGVMNLLKNTNLSHLRLSHDDLVEVYLNSIKESEDKEKHCGWIISGIQPNVTLMESLMDHLPNEVFVLKDSSIRYEFLVNRFRTNDHEEFIGFKALFEEFGKTDAAKRCPAYSTDTYKGRMLADITRNVLDICISDTFDENDEEEMTEEQYFSVFPRRRLVENYFDQIVEYERRMVEVKKFFTNNDIRITEIDVAHKSIRDWLIEMLAMNDNKYRQPPTIFTAADREEELKDFSEPVLMGDEEEAEPEEEAVIGSGFDMLLRNRRYGDTYGFCPVTFKDHYVLWRGKDDIAAKFESKLYFFTSESAMTKFLFYPKNYTFREPPWACFGLPPPRICITGLGGSGKSAIGADLARNLGVYYIDFIDRANAYDPYEVVAYLERNEPLSQELLQNTVYSLWHQEPMRTVGFVLDGFPRRMPDLDYMLFNTIIPDIIIDLTAQQPLLQERFRLREVADWEKRFADERKKEQVINAEMFREWEENTATYLTAVFETVRQRRYDRAVKFPKHVRISDNTDDEDVGEEVSESDQISYNSVAAEEDMTIARGIVEERFPRPKPSTNLQTDEQFIAELNEKFERLMAADAQFFSPLKDMFNTEMIPWTTIDANLTRSRVFAQVMKTVDGIKFRDESLFERCYDISTELAESLLNCGYYFLSQFGRTCPVQYYEKNNTFQMYAISKEKFTLFPIIHRQYIYFLADKKNRDKFVENPLSYILETGVKYPLISFRVAIIGPPKSGKSTLAAKIKSELGFKHISIGKAARYVLRFLPYTHLAQEIETVLRNGWEMTDEMEIRCVEAMCFDASATALGAVFDGFPNNLEEVRHLARLGLLPHLVIDLTSTPELIEQFRSLINNPIYTILNGTLNAKLGNQSLDNLHLPVFNKEFIMFRYDRWMDFQNNFRHWLDQEYQIVRKIRVEPCKWGVWHAAYELATAVMFEIRYYYAHVQEDRPLRLTYMQVSPMEFVHRRSSFKEYCLCCLFYTKSLVTSGFPPDRTNLVQYKYFYYWVCDEHLEEFIGNPCPFLTPYNTNKLPICLPKRVYLIEMPDNVIENGLCLVCYEHHLPDRQITKGLLEFAVEYDGKTFLFCSTECLERFMRYPRQFTNITVNFKGVITADLLLKELSVTGYLEQTVATEVINAVINTVKHRPIICGKDIATAAAINMALRLKINNPKVKMEFKQVYTDAYDLMRKRQRTLERFLNERKERLNPYLYYQQLVVPPVFSEISLKNCNSDIMSIKFVEEQQTGLDATIFDD